MMAEALFEVTAADVADTSDDSYTPRWVFAAAGLVFDLDVAAPVDPAMRTCPARAYLTPVEDGLTHPWHGVVWMNPPYSRVAPWVDRWADHPDGLALLPAMHEVKWLGVLMRSADAITLPTVEFSRPGGGNPVRWRQPAILAARGAVSASALARVAAADKYVRGAYHVHP
jgi:hypothetical protein